MKEIETEMQKKTIPFIILHQNLKIPRNNFNQGRKTLYSKTVRHQGRLKMTQTMERCTVTVNILIMLKCPYHPNKSIKTNINSIKFQKAFFINWKHIILKFIRNHKRL